MPIRSLRGGEEASHVKRRTIGIRLGIEGRAREPGGTSRILPTPSATNRLAALAARGRSGLPHASRWRLYQGMKLKRSAHGCFPCRSEPRLGRRYQDAAVDGLEGSPSADLDQRRVDAIVPCWFRSRRFHAPFPRRDLGAFSFGHRSEEPDLKPQATYVVRSSALHEEASATFVASEHASFPTRSADAG